MARAGIDKTRIVISALIVIALGMIIYGFASAQTGDKAVRITDAAIESVYPQPGDIVLRQSEIRIDLAQGYRGVLIVDGQEIPTYDLQSSDTGSPTPPRFDAIYDPALNTVSFTPKVGATKENLSPGRHTVTAVYWKLDESRDRARSFTWAFNVS
jgi:hypothetical protein